jgi:hypothetical protein
MRKLVRLLMPIAIAALLGPLVGALIFCLLSTLSYVFDTTDGDHVADLFNMFRIYILFAYLDAGAIALLAGLLVSTWMIWRRPSLVVAIVAAVTAVGLFRLAVEIGMLIPYGGELVRDNLALTFAMAVVAAGVCWLLTGRFVKTTRLS